MTTTTETRVGCNVCRKAVATKLVKDNGYQTYPVCGSCLKGMHQPTILGSIKELKVGVRVKTKCSDPRLNRESRIAETTVNSLGKVMFILEDGGWFLASELVAV